MLCFAESTLSSMWYTVLAAFIIYLEVASDYAVADEAPLIVHFLERDLVEPGDALFTSALHLPCTGTGSRLHYTWKFNIISVEDVDPLGSIFKILDNGTLSKNKAEGGDGEYQCIVKNSKGTTFSRKMKVKVTEIHPFTRGSDKTLQVSLGRPATLQCPPRVYGFGVEFFWKKEINQKVQFFKDNERRAITPKGHLHIMYVTSQDINSIQLVNGIQCRIVAGGQYEDSMSINVQSDGTDYKEDISPSFIVKPSETESAIEGYQKVLHCIATGKPAPVITWKKDGKTIIDGTDSFKLSQFKRKLTITKVNREKHQGTYLCEAKSANAPQIETSTDFTVKEQPHWTPGKKPGKKISINFEENATLTCAAEGIPNPAFTWYKDDILLQPNDHLTADGTKLQFKKVQKEQEGLYHCVAKNDVGMLVSSTWVHVNLDGGWSKFEPSGECSNSCGKGGSQEYRRGCTSPHPAPGGAACSGPDRETRECNEHPCPVNGGWSDFGPWGECSKSCGRGLQERMRKCTSPQPVHNGANCSGSDRNYRTCNENPCPAVSVLDPQVTSQKNWLLTGDAIIVFLCVVFAVLILGVLVVVCLLWPKKKRRKDGHKVIKTGLAREMNANMLDATEEA